MNLFLLKPITSMLTDAPVLGIICGGGPSPGVNGVIAAAIFSARRLHWTVYGFHDGFLHLSTGDPAVVRANMIPLDQEDASQFYRAGGSIVRSDRYDPTRSPQKIAGILSALAHFKVRYLLILGGNDKIATTHIVTRGVDPAEMQVIFVPKTVDNDIQLPVGECSLGFRSAVDFASRIVRNLTIDASTSPRFFIVETLGKASGHLAFRTAEAVGAQLALIPEDFGDKTIELNDLCDIIEASIIKKLASGKQHGVIVMCESLVTQMSSWSVQGLMSSGDVTADSTGRVILERTELSRSLCRELNVRFQARRLDVRVTSKKIDYEIRSQPPNEFDAVYGQALGYAAVEGFRQGHSNCMVVFENAKIAYKSFRSLGDPVTMRIAPMRVDVGSQSYVIGRFYFTYLTDEDFEPERIEQIAAAGNFTPEEFVARFRRIPQLLVVPGAKLENAKKVF
jgi:6-phosphofructokinase 1